MSFAKNLCRTCGQLSEVCHDIYRPDNNGNTIQYKLLMCLNLEVSYNLTLVSLPT